MPPSVSTKYFLGALRTTGTKSIEYEDWKTFLKALEMYLLHVKIQYSYRFS